MLNAEEVLKKHKREFKIFEDFAQKCAIATAQKVQQRVLADHFILQECFYRSVVSQNIYSLSDEGTNHFKKTGHLCYWIRKLKPFRWSDNVTKKIQNVPLNEYLGLIIGLYMIEAVHKELMEDPEVPQNLKDASFEKRKWNLLTMERMTVDMVRSFRYHNYSFGSIPIMLETLYWLPLDNHEKD